MSEKRKKLNKTTDGTTERAIKESEKQVSYIVSTDEAEAEVQRESEKRKKSNKMTDGTTERAIKASEKQVSYIITTDGEEAEVPKQP